MNVKRFFRLAALLLMLVPLAACAGGSGETVCTIRLTQHTHDSPKILDEYTAQLLADYPAVTAFRMTGSMNLFSAEGIREGDPATGYRLVAYSADAFLYEQEPVFGLPYGYSGDIQWRLSNGRELTARRPYAWLSPALTEAAGIAEDEWKKGGALISGSAHRYIDCVPLGTIGTMWLSVNTLGETSLEEDFPYSERITAAGVLDFGWEAADAKTAVVSFGDYRLICQSLLPEVGLETVVPLDSAEYEISGSYEAFVAYAAEKGLDFNVFSLEKLDSKS